MMIGIRFPTLAGTLSPLAAMAVLSGLSIRILELPDRTWALELGEGGGRQFVAITVAINKLFG